ncbi:AEC family transporter [Falsigemmobacter faecalis]|uniref:AEC family transporter n=1 Tax=Falsigemmobacter faecalis TaxID=2488730 RepID=A0A3P3D4C9_9RHOB|nr:AEC family transporter [Falsigemmobacter faecalis]RRH69235.1 AEC family transporter [Falsigemmobacter faecalis]
MLDILARTLPFFALTGLGWVVAVRGLITPAENAALTKFVFYFALSAMLLALTSGLSLGDMLDGRVFAAYGCAWALVWLLGFTVARLRGLPLAEAAMEAQCGVIGNTGFLGLPMLVVILGPSSALPVLQVLILDMVIFNPLITLIITAARGGGLGIASLKPLAVSLMKNPIIVSSLTGLGWSLTGIPLPAPALDFLELLGRAATPVALFVIGVSLAGKGAGSLLVTGWISALKLVVHPLVTAVFALWVFDLPAPVAAAMVAAAALPVAGNVYILAAHYGVAPQRVSASILVSTVAAILTVTLVLAWVAGFQ